MPEPTIIRSGSRTKRLRCGLDRNAYVSAMPSKRKSSELPALTAEWSLPTAATLGSAVRAKGILLEIRAKLPAARRKYLDVRPGRLVLGMPAGTDSDFSHITAGQSEPPNLFPALSGRTPEADSLTLPHDDAFRKSIGEIANGDRIPSPAPSGGKGAVSTGLGFWQARNYRETSIG